MIPTNLTLLRFGFRRTAAITGLLLDLLAALMLSGRAIARSRAAALTAG